MVCGSLRGSLNNASLSGAVVLSTTANKLDLKCRREQGKWMHKMGVKVLKAEK